MVLVTIFMESICTGATGTEVFRVYPTSFEAGMDVVFTVSLRLWQPVIRFMGITQTRRTQLVLPIGVNIG